MAIFPHIEIEGVVQVNDRTRIDATKSFADKGEAAISLVEIDPDGSGFINVTGTSNEDWFLDWEYSTDAGSPYTVSVRITTDGAPTIETKTISVLSEADDMLYSNDQDIMSLEPNILDYNRGGSRKGKNTFLDKHREAQKTILDHLDELGYINEDDTRITKDQIIVNTDVNRWSKYLALGFIFEGLSNSVGDVFDLKAGKYRGMAKDASHRAILRIDFNKDSSISGDEINNFKTIRLVRR